MTRRTACRRCATSSRATASRARRSLGQHFLLDLNLTGRSRAPPAISPHGTVIEIGPGPGGLTRALLAHGAAQSSRSSATTLPRGARRDRRGLSRPADVIEGDALAGRLRHARRRRRAASSPTCPTTSRRRCCIAGSQQAPTPSTSLTADVPEGGRRPAGRPAAQQGLRPPVDRWRNGAARCAALFDIAAARLHAAAEGRLDAWSQLMPRAAAAGAGADRSDLERVTAPPSASAARCCAQSLSSAGRRAEPLLAAAGIDADARAPRRLDRRAVRRAGRAWRAARHA